MTQLFSLQYKNVMQHKGVTRGDLVVACTYGHTHTENLNSNAHDTAYKHMGKRQTICVTQSVSFLCQYYQESLESFQGIKTLIQSVVVFKLT